MNTEELIDEVTKQRATVAKLKTQKVALLAACKSALAELEGIMPQWEPDDHTHSAWETIEDLKSAIEQAGESGTRIRVGGGMESLENEIDRPGEGV